jgi:hypothetical protein
VDARSLVPIIAIAILAAKNYYIDGRIPQTFSVVTKAQFLGIYLYMDMYVLVYVLVYVYTYIYIHIYIYTLITYTHIYIGVVAGFLSNRVAILLTEIKNELRVEDLLSIVPGSLAEGYRYVFRSVHICIFKCVYMNSYICMCIYIYMYIYMYMYIYIYIHIYVYFIIG